MQSVSTVDANGLPRKAKSPIIAAALRICRRHIAARVPLNVYNFELAELLFLCYFLGLMLWGQFAISVQFLVYDMRASSSVGTCGFGQLLPTFLILLPFFTLIETYGGAKSPS
jgi:hypothetical protein